MLIIGLEIDILISKTEFEESLLKCIFYPK